MRREVTRVSSEIYLELIVEAVLRTGGTQTAAVQQAARLIADSLMNDGVLHTFGTGHSEAPAMELVDRTGGLVPTNRITLRDLVIYGGREPDFLEDPLLERDPSIVEQLLAIATVRPTDIFIVVSHSGINGSVVEFARQVKERGHPLIAIMSLAHSRRSESRHPSGSRLSDLADVVLDNGAPYGDAAIPLSNGCSVGAVSSVTAVVLAQMLVSEVLRQLIDADHVTPVYQSSNVPGGFTHNQKLNARYAGRIRRTA